MNQLFFNLPAIAFLLNIPHTGIKSVIFHKLTMSSLFGNFAPVKQNYFVRTCNGLELVCYHYNSSTLDKLFYRLMNITFVFGLKR